MPAVLSRVRAGAVAAARGTAARPWGVLAVWAVACGAVHRAIWSGISWHYFAQGARLLFSPAGLHLYATHPQLQTGPLTFAAVAPLVFGLPPAAAEALAMLLMSGAGLAVLALAAGLAPRREKATGPAFLLAGLCFLLVWSELAVTYAHPDDVLAILATALALRVLQRGRPEAAALLLGLAAGCKPWALAFAPVLLLAGGGRRLRVFGVWLAAAGAVWLPFCLADPGTLAAIGYRLPVSPASPLRLLAGGLAAAPLWVRPAQLGLGAALGVLAVRRGRGSAVILAAVAARLLLDPSIKSYYDAGLLAGCVLYDLALAGRLPVLTVSAVAVFYLPMFPLQPLPGWYGPLRAAYLVAVMAVAVCWPRKPAPAPAPAARAPRQAAPAAPGSAVPAAGAGAQQPGGTGNPPAAASQARATRRQVASP